MRFQIGRRLVPGLGLGVALLIGVDSRVTAQAPEPTQETAAPPAAPAAPAAPTPPAAPAAPAPPAPTAEPAAPPVNLPPPANPAPATPPAEAAANSAAVPGTPADYEARIQQLEAIVRQMQAQQVSGSSGGGGSGGGVGGGGGASTTAPDPGTAAGRPGANPGQGGAGSATPSASGGASAPGQSLPVNPSVEQAVRLPGDPGEQARQGQVRAGLRDQERRRGVLPPVPQPHPDRLPGVSAGGPDPGPRHLRHPPAVVHGQRPDHPTRRYFVSLQNAVDTVSMLDVFVDLNYNPKLQARVGRFKTPFTYEFLVQPIQGLIIPERSLFFNNFGQNRDLGAMAYGRLFDGSFDYAAGVFNGTRNGFVSNQDSKFFSGFVNWLPFKGNENTLFENLNVGGSVFTGNANSPAIPSQLRTAVATTGNAALGVPFLTFNNNVRETGNQAFWDVHVAYFYNHLAVIGEYAGRGARLQPVVQRRLADPRRRRKLLRPGRLPPHRRDPQQRRDRQAAPPVRPPQRPARAGCLGTHRPVQLPGRRQQRLHQRPVRREHLGQPRQHDRPRFNWHLTQYMKLYFDWQHAAYNQPVIFAPGRRQATSDLFLVRFQLYF